eukprot:c20410_g1_i1 orf=365-2569(+)
MLLEEAFEEPEPPEDLMSLDDDETIDDVMVLDNNPDEEFIEFDPSGRYGRYAEVLGKGAMKTVYKAYDMIDCKEVAWNKAKPSTEGPAEQAHAVEREVVLLQQLSHKGIIKLYSAWVDESSGDTNFITELCSSSLLAFRVKHKHVSRKAVKSWARQILEGLVHLHTQDPPIIHRDLKCENIFVKYSSSTVLKIGDFGSATVLDDTHHMHTLVGTPEFMAPEMFQEDYNELVDVYSFGMCMLELLTRECPYSECKSIAQIYKKVIGGEKPKSLLKVKDVLALQFISRCLLPAYKRPSAKELLADPFLQHKEVSVNSVQAMNPSKSMPSLRDFTTSVPGKLIFGGCDASKPAPPCRGGREGRMVDQTGVNLKVNNSNVVSRDAVCAPKVAPLCRSYQVTGTVEDENTLRLRIRIQESSRCSNIVFPFNLRYDTPESVAEEMVRTLDYPQSDMITIADLISEELAILALKGGEGSAVSTCSVDPANQKKNVNLPMGTSSSESRGSLVASVDAKLQLGQSDDSCIYRNETPKERQQENIGTGSMDERAWLLPYKSCYEYASEIAVPADHVRANHSFSKETLAADRKSSIPDFEKGCSSSEKTFAESGKFSGEKETDQENKESLFDKDPATLVSYGSIGLSTANEASAMLATLISNELTHEEPFIESATSVSKEGNGSSPAEKNSNLRERSNIAAHNKRMRHLVLKNFSRFKQRSAMGSWPVSEQALRRRHPLYVNTIA